VPQGCGAYALPLPCDPSRTAREYSYDSGLARRKWRNALPRSQLTRYVSASGAEHRLGIGVIDSDGLGAPTFAL
jgi:hypothetical protein